jgi:hypothetical protein
LLGSSNQEEIISLSENRTTNNNDVESCASESDYAVSVSRSIISINGSSHGSNSSSGSSIQESVKSLAASIKDTAATVSSKAASKLRMPSLTTPASYRTTRKTFRTKSSVSAMRYGTNLSPHAADGYDDEKPNRRPRVVYALMALSVLLMAAIIGVAVVIFRGGSRGGSNNSSSSSKSSREQALDAILLQLSSADALMNTNTPQYQAREWLLYKDTLWTPPAPAVSSDRIQQRYILGVLYYATAGPTQWATNNNWMTGDECDASSGGNGFWVGIDCNSYGQVRAMAFGKSKGGRGLDAWFPGFSC